MRPIDADALMKTVFNDVVLVDGEVKGVGLILAETVDKAPTIGAVPVVRCWECDHKTHDENDRPYCLKLEMYLNKELDFFCKYGEREQSAE